MAIPKRTRYEVLRRDSFTCRYCGAKAPDVELTVDHVMPVALGGSDNPDNLVTACRDCNAGKASTHPDDQTVNDVAEDAERWTRARQQAADELTSRRAAIENQFTVFYMAWTKWDKNAAYLPTNADTIFSNWLNRGLTLEDVLEAHTIAMGARHISVYRVWRYMCGVLRRRVSEIDALASTFLTSEGH